MHEVGLDHIIGAGSMTGESGRMMLFWPVFLVVDVRDGTHGDAENAIRRRRDPPSLQLACSPREIQERRRIVIPGANNKRDLVFFLKVVQFFGEL